MANNKRLNLEYNLFMLNNTPGVGVQTMNKLDMTALEAIDTEDIWDYIEVLSQQFKRMKPVTDKAVQEDIIKKFVKNTDYNIKHGIKSIVLTDEEYPEQLKAIPNPPIVLYAKGNVAALKERGIAGVGSRNLSVYGRQIANRLGEFLAENNIVAISGLAVGTDELVHEGCIKKNGITVAVLPSGLDKVYPKSNAKLAEDILATNGCLISEYTIGTAVLKGNFVARDRIQYGLANGVIVIETTETGGTMHAVKGALNLKRPVAAFKYPQKIIDDYALQDKQTIFKYENITPIFAKDSILQFFSICGSDTDAVTDVNSVEIEQQTLFD